MRTRSRLPRSISVVLCGAFFFAAGFAHAGWQEIDDWQNGFGDESNIDGQNGWDSPGGHAIVVDPTNAANKVLDAGGGNTNSVKPALLADGDIGSVYYRMYVPSGNEANADFELDLTSVTNLTGSSPGGTEFRYHGDGAGPNNIEVHDESFLSTNINFADDTWYDVWYVVDNHLGDFPTYEAYVQGGAFTTQTLVSHSSGSDTEFIVRHASQTDDLVNIYVRGNGSAANDHAYYDDIFFDPAGMNLTVPVVILPNGDFNGDEEVNRADYDIWRMNVFTGSTHAEGDFDLNGVVDLDDFGKLKEVIDLGGAVVGNIPEPGGVTLFAIAVGLGWLVGQGGVRSRSRN